jgi:CSLREA domain-containing protein
MKNVITNIRNYFSGELESSETCGANKGETAAPNRFFAKTKQAAFVFGSVLSLFLFLSLTSLEAQAATFFVNTKDDAIDANVGDGVCDTHTGLEPQCSLRAAIQEANFSLDIDDIMFSLDGSITLTLGWLPITSSMNINGPGARTLAISPIAATHSGVFDIKHRPTGFVNISGVTVSGANRNSGIIIRLGAGTVNLTEVAVKDNTAEGNGGGIANYGGTLNLVRSTVSNNLALNGGGIYNDLSGVTNIINSTICDNRAVNRGGGGGNFDLSGGGGIANYAGEMTLINATVSYNVSSSQGGGIALLLQTTRIRNTIVAMNQVVEDKAANGPDVYGWVDSKGNNLIGSSFGNSGFINGVGGDQVGTDEAYLYPVQGILRNNGGQTDTIALHLGSTALNAGNSCVVQAPLCLAEALITDQRGMLRKYGKSVDIGAFESKTLGTTDPVSIGGKISLPNNRVLRNAPTIMTSAIKIFD